MEAMTSRLRTVADRESIQIDDDALPVIARQATGSLRDALGMLDQIAVYRESADETGQSISAEMVRAVLGVSRNERVESLARALADRDPAAGLREISAAVDAGDDIRQLGRQVVAYIRLLLLQNAGGTVDADETARDLAARFSLEELAGLIRQMSDIDFRAKRSAFPQLPLEIAIVEGAQRGQPVAGAGAPGGQTRDESHGRSPDIRSADAPPSREHDSPPSDAPAVPRTSLKDRVRGSAPALSRTAAAQSRTPDNSPSESVAAPPKRQDALDDTRQSSSSVSASGSGELSLSGIVDLWSKIRADVKAINRRIEALLQQVDPAAVNGSQVILVSPYEFHRNRVNTDEVRQVVESVIGRLVNAKVQVTCVAREEAQLMGGGTVSAVASPAPIQHPQPAKVPAAEPKAENVAPATDVQDPVLEVKLVDVVDAEGVADQVQKDDLARITAAKNIFDAEEIKD
jgi:DNA polymerase-3 subunit gamma/tau